MSLIRSERLILSLCDHSGAWSQPYLDAGYRVDRVDIKTDGRDVRLLKMPSDPVWGVLAAPPCTVFANSGARWPRTDAEMVEGLSVVDACIRLVMATRPRWWALENPIGKLSRYLGEPAWTFQPFWFSDPYTKATHLWGDFTVPTRRPVFPKEGSKMHTQYGGKSERTKAARSVTPAGFARAFFEANP